MLKRNQKSFYTGLLFLLLFVVWTVLISFIDIKAVGPKNSNVGFATINTFFHRLTGTNMFLYTITDWLGLIPIAICLGFAILGLVQSIKRKSIIKVDTDILYLGIFYIAVIAVYLLFEEFVINYRPVLINGYLEVSYPSSTTLLVMCVMPTAIMQFDKRIKISFIKNCINIIITVFIAFMVIARLISGVHWLTDIIGGLLLSTGLVTVYYTYIKHHIKSF
jgi:undecaprenyl-diphosphatase